MRKFRSDWGEVRNPNASRRYKLLLRSFDQLQQTEPLRKVKSTTSRGLPLHLCPVRWRTLAAIQIVRNCFPTQGEALSKAENGMPSRRTTFSSPNRHERPAQNQSSKSNHLRGGGLPSRCRDRPSLPAERFRIPCIPGCFGNQRR